MKWNTTTLKNHQLIEEQGGDTQVIFQDRKVHSSLSFGADVVYRRTYRVFDTHGFCWGASCEHPKKPKNPNLRRCDIVFFGFQIVQGKTPGTVVMSLTSAMNELGNIPQIVIVDELKKIALRVCKIGQRVGEIRRLAQRGPTAPTPATGGGKVCASCRQPGTGLFCAFCGGRMI